MNIEKRIRELLNEKEWTFASLLNMEKVLDEISDIIYNEMSPEQKLEMSWKQDINNEIIENISETVAKIVKEELMQAEVSFGNKNKEEDENEISEGSVGWKSLKERTANEKTDSK